MMTPQEHNRLALQIAEILYEEDVSVVDALSVLADARSDLESLYEAAWERQQERLMEAGGPDDSAYRQQLRDAGRGHLVK